MVLEEERVYESLELQKMMEEELLSLDKPLPKEEESRKGVRCSTPRASIPKIFKCFPIQTLKLVSRRQV